jgi:hypothetical protein
MGAHASSMNAPHSSSQPPPGSSSSYHRTPHSFHLAPSHRYARASSWRTSSGNNSQGAHHFYESKPPVDGSTTGTASTSSSTAGEESLVSDIPSPYQEFYDRRPTPKVPVPPPNRQREATLPLHQDEDDPDEITRDHFRKVYDLRTWDMYLRITSSREKKKAVSRSNSGTAATLQPLPAAAHLIAGPQVMAALPGNMAAERHASSRSSNRSHVSAEEPSEDLFFGDLDED